MSRKATARGREHVYVFCAVRGPVNARALAKLPSMPDGAHPRAVSLTKNITVVASDVSADTYQADAIESRLHDLDWVARCGAAHHGVADVLALKHTIVPFRLFTLFSSEDKAVAMLSRVAKRIDEALDAVKGKAEWVLRISKPDPARTEPAANAGQPTSGTSFLAQKAAAKQSAAERAVRIRNDIGAIFNELAEIADEANERSIDAATGLLLDAAFLVPTRRASAFKRALEKAADGLLKNGCRVSLTGPWPPYSFVALDTRSARV